MKDGAQIHSGSTLDVAIVGGGITGLSAAFRVRDGGGSGVRFRLLEAKERLGGQIQTERQGPFLLEGGPDSIVTHKPGGIDLCRRLGLDGELLRPRPAPSGTQVLHDRRLLDLPRGFRLLVPTRVGPLLGSPLFSYRGKLRILAERFVPRRHASAEDETVRRFVSRRFGRELFDRVAEPILGGLFTADADRLSLEMTLPRLMGLERRYGSVSRGVSRVRVRRGPGTVESEGFISLRSGLGSLVARLADRLPEETVRRGAPLRGLRLDRGSGEWVLQAESMDELRARAVILTCPAFEAARLLSGLDDRLSRELRDLDYASCVTVNLGYAASQIRRPLKSYGFFVPRNAGLPLLACSHVSGKFAARAPTGEVLLRAFLGGALAPDILDATDARLVQTAHETLDRLLGIEGGPTLATVHRYPRSMPQFVVGHRRRIDTVQERLRDQPGLLLAGAAMGAIGLPDCIRSGERAAEAALSLVAADPRRLELAI